MGPTMGPRTGPVMGPNPVIGGDPLVGFAATFTTNYSDGFLFLTLPATVAFGSGPFRLTTDGALPDGLLAATDYYAIPTIGSPGDPAAANDTIRLAASYVDALASTAVSFVDDGTGTHAITYTG